VFVSAEVIALLGVGVTQLLAFFSGLAWIHARMDKRFDVVDRQFDAVDRQFDAVDRRFDAVFKRFEAVDRRFAELERELTEVKIAVARMEGPQPRFVTGR
jgi:hypothetical protein